MKILFLLGSRGEWGYIEPVIREFTKKRHEVEICATNMAILDGYGNLAAKLERDGIPIKYRVHSSISGDNLASMAKSIGLLEMSLVDILSQNTPDWLVLAGDRAEQLAGAIAGAYCYIPTAHIQAGERSGNIDGVARHAISKLVHFHLASNQDAAQRLISSGEELTRVHITGAPQIDDIYQKNFLTRSELASFRIIKHDGPFVLACIHPVTEDLASTELLISEVMLSLKNLEKQVVWVLPNNDAGGERIRSFVLDGTRSKDAIHVNLDREKFLALMANADWMIGNSSSGILEAPSFSLPAINIGRRQADRFRGENVIDSEIDRTSIKNAIARAENPTFRSSIQGMLNPYGHGDAAKKIVSILESTQIDSALLIKRMTY
jgi:GDP/UDP-N,N'-diacetylbacillosamine 2-epimerase (hydrolysing)